MGASAGGLQAFEEFFTHVPATSGMTFVVVSHQDPTRTTMLPELLERSANIPVRVISDGMIPRPNTIHVAPPGKNVAMIEGAMQLMEVPEHRGAALPIDYFFRSMAEDQHDNAICIVFSGNGSDGTLGLRAVKAESGLAVVQDPATAKFTGMPDSAIATGLADYVLPPDQMPAQLQKYLSSPRRSLESEDGDEAFLQALRKVLILVRGRTGHDFSAYKPTTIRRRIERRMGVHQFENPNHYVRFMEQNPQETDILFRELLISVTTFFRDPDAFEALARALPKLLASKPDEFTLRVWVPGCATGEEAYSVAIALRECMEEMGRHLPMHIFGTDLDGHAIDVARNGLYPEGIAVDVSRKRLERFFLREDNGYRINKDIRQCLVFAPQNLISDPPFTKLDLITCRNLLIYLNADLQRQIVPLFHYALRPSGLLMLGSSETIGGFSDLFTPMDSKWKIYERKHTTTTAPTLVEPSASVADTESEPAARATIVDRTRIKSVAEAVEQALLSRFVPPSVIVNEKGDIHHIHGRTGMYLEPAAGRPSLNLFKMAREGLQLELAAAMRKAGKFRGVVRREGVRVATNGGHAHVNLSVSRISRPESLKGLYLVAFEEAPPQVTEPVRKKAQVNKGAHSRLVDLERELQHTKETLRSTIEESETTNEELKSMNEELQSTNEELQSANEELETSKEEMQSLNEELQTVNSELQGKIDELSQANDDMNNLLNSTEIATVFLDSDLRIQRFTKQARRLIKLIETDVGRSIGDIVSKLRFESLEAAAQEVLDTLSPKEKEVQTADGNWFLMRMMPYRTSRNVIEGLVITFVDINDLKAAESVRRELEAAHAFADAVIETIREPFLLLDGELRVVKASRRFYETFAVGAGETEGRLVYELGDGQWNIPALRELLEQVLPQETALTDFRVNHEFPHIGSRTMILNGRRLARETGEPAFVFLAIEDVTDGAGGR